MDAEKMEFPDNQFDVVFSRAVFEHVPGPAPVISEIRRVLKPGGVMFVLLHLFSSDSGCHDTRIFVGQRGELPFWAHLRPEHEQSVRSNSYLNKLRLADWKTMFESIMPGSEVTALCDAGDTERQELHELRSQGQLTNYSDDELLTVTLQVTWRKPY
jgi:ubiquinone/menaquinone biosynthesis C-methylase UbiE